MRGELQFTGLAPHNETAFTLNAPPDGHVLRVESPIRGCTAFIDEIDGDTLTVVLENRTARTVSGVVSWETYEPEPVETIEE